jgi:hypothetical protein
VAVTCAPPSGSTFTVGATTVTCTASDAAGNSASGSFTVTVTLVDVTPPILTLPGNLALDTATPAGAVATFAASAEDAVDGPVAVTCAPPSGSTFTVGATTVTCTASDAAGNAASGSFTVTVTLVDVTPPILTLPGDLALAASGSAGAVATFAASAVDAVDGPVAVTCAPPSGSTFPIGTTIVSCSASDAAGNTASGTFTVSVGDATPPLLTLPRDLTVEATSAAGAVVMFTASAQDGLDGPVPVACAPPAGSTFPIRRTTVTCMAADAAGNTASGTFTVTVRDRTAPVLTLPASFSVAATSAAGAVVTFTASAADIVDGAVRVSCRPRSGSTFPIGTTRVGCEALDGEENRASGSFTVTVVDESAPVLTLPDAPAVEAASGAGAVVTYSVSALDAVDGPLAASCLPLSGSTLPIGTTSVACSATDAAGNTASGSFEATVGDTRPPTVAVPPDQRIGARGRRTLVYEYAASATDLVDGPVAVTCRPASGSRLPLGVTTITCTAADAHGNPGSASFNVEVRRLLWRPSP